MPWATAFCPWNPMMTVKSPPKTNVRTVMAKPPKIIPNRRRSRAFLLSLYRGTPRLPNFIPAECYFRGPIFSHAKVTVLWEKPAEEERVAAGALQELDGRDIEQQPTEDVLDDA